MTFPFKNFGVVGAGAWGTALAVTLQRAGRDVALWARREELRAVMAERRENVVYLPGIGLSPDIKITGNLADFAGCHALILASPAQHLRSLCKALAPCLGTAFVPLIIASKGIELTTYRLMSEIVAQELPGHPIFVLSGPSFAIEVAQNRPAALTLSGESGGENLALAMSSPTFRLYTTDDIIGAQIGGAVKNVLAIACGIVSGRALGENARAALITRGLAEIMRLGTALGARAETLMGLSGLGDVVLTCSSTQSRNMSLGFSLGQGRDLIEILATRKGVTEGISTAVAALGLARRHGIEMPVTAAVDLILREKTGIDESITALLSRPLRNETV
ncbi:MAG: NAD(P)-dependent glycerol-3-phosphate dehydrogenase [Alphaproteobacteria bacterium]|nr:NAD(P)-dependent glycerol-3-phosphate dehydrogenase [Alphaproteobacteria bacterium]